VGVLVFSNPLFCDRLQVLSVTMLFLEQEHACDSNAPSIMTGFRVQSLIRHSPKTNRYRLESGSAFEAQISDNRTNWSLEAQLKCSRSYHQYRDGKGKAHNVYSGRYAEGSQRANPADKLSRSIHGIRSPDQSHSSSRLPQRVQYKRRHSLCANTCYACCMLHFVLFTELFPS
jgi:hypothetical protein